MTKFKKGFKAKKVGLIEFISFPNTKQTKKIGKYVKEYNLELYKIFTEKIVTDHVNGVKSTKVRLAELEEESIKEANGFNLAMTQKLILLLTNLDEKDLTLDLFKKYNEDLSEIVSEINIIIQPFTEEFQRVLQKNIKKYMVNSKAGA